ncbi:hypothetical protein ACVBEQ_15250 [Nakamurella sp. GG22]
MTQLSLFSADLTPPQLADLGGLLAAHGQLTVGDGGTRVSILLADEWRAAALLRECRVRDIPAKVSDVTAPGDVEPDAAADVVIDPAADPAADPERPVGRTLLATDRSPLLAGLADEWTRGAVKAVPPGLVVGAGFLRVWTLAAGRPAEIGFLLGLDPHAPDTHEPLAAACAASGLTGSLLGVRGGGPAVRIVGYRRCSRLAEMIGTPPPEAPPHSFPPHGH